MTASVEPSLSPLSRTTEGENLLARVSHENPVFDFHGDEPHANSDYQEKLNRLRAAVLGANDGIVSVAATVVGVAGATTSTSAIGIAAAAAVVGGSISMALGEFVSVSSQVDSQHALIEKERHELATDPDSELAELAGLLTQRGLSKHTALQAARELTAKDALGSHLDFELGIDAEDIPSPWTAALASAGAFLLGALLPTLLILLLPVSIRIPATFIGVLVALAITGALGAKWGGSPRYVRAAIRVVVGGGLALAATYLIGMLLGTAIA
ncbi:VIT1/CCC1 transporter family protein [Rothia aerolata]|uniref:Membrane protein n=1 Tax=Rothia aerolata TaxID=1812262 RepID=A0A917IS60_9MICC|nr:VIT family protein [Rothia aerolata]GGH62128.1 membrane protein [Rothia aerolata]